MDGQRFDRITRALASGASRRRILRGIAGGVAAGVAAAVGRGDADAQVTQAQCGNKTCASNPGVCNAGCVCCVYGNGNSRCRPPGTCGSGQEICANGQPACGSDGCCLAGEVCTQFGVCSPEETAQQVQGSAAAAWAALTDAATLASLGIPSTIAPRVGHRFQFGPTASGETDAVIEAEVVEVDAPHRFAFTWLNGPLDEPTTVTVHIGSVEDGGPATIRLTHTDASGASCLAGARVLGRHWGPRLFNEALPAYLARQRRP